METINYLHLIDSNFIEFSGEDCKDFLQGMITNDINKCDNEKSIYSCLLTPQGKFLADFFIIKKKNKYLIEIHNKFKNDFLSKISIYKLRSKVNIKELNNYNSFIFFKNSDLDFIDKDISVFNDPRKSGIGTKAYLEKKDNNKLSKQKNINIVSLDFYKILLMKNLIPFTANDMMVNKSLLLENNFENLNAIDWEKGCYVGQEITARMKYRSLLKKRIRTLELISGNINIGEKLFFNEKEIGEIISYTDKFAIGMLKIEAATSVVKEKAILKTKDGLLKIFK